MGTVKLSVRLANRGTRQDSLRGDTSWPSVEMEKYMSRMS
jgi:hypothetical protein